MSEKFSNVAKLFRLYFCASKTKSTSQARIKPEIFVNFRPEPGLNQARTRPEKPGPTYNSGSMEQNLFQERPKIAAFFCNTSMLGHKCSQDF